MIVMMIIIIIIIIIIMVMVVVVVASTLRYVWFQVELLLQLLLLGPKKVWVADASQRWASAHPLHNHNHN